MTSKMKQTTDENGASVFSVRVSPETKAKVDQLLADINRPFGKKRITGDKLVALLPNLLTDELKNHLRRQARTGEEEREIWRQIHIKKVGAISKDGFLKFMMTPEWIGFMEKYHHEFEKLA